MTGYRWCKNKYYCAECKDERGHRDFTRCRSYRLSDN